MENRNVILITIDCLRADHIGCLGYDRNTTPNIDRLAEEGTLFTQAISQGPDSPSSFQAILTSTYPLMFEGYNQFSEYRTMISEILTKNDYTTAAFHGNPYFSKYFGYHRGFDHFNDFLTSRTKSRQKSSRPIRKAYRNFFQLIKKTLGKYLFNKSQKFQEFRRSSLGRGLEKIMDTQRSPSADVITPKVIDWLREYGSENFFLWMHYMDAHEPTMPPKEYLELFNPSPNMLDSTGASERIESGDLTQSELKEILNGLIDLYDAEIRYVDEFIGRLVEELKKLGLMENTMIIITADHGEQFFEHGGMAHGSLYEEVINVPLLIIHPDSDAKTIESQARLLDLPPTVLDYLNVEKPTNFLGKSLLPKMKGESTEETGVITEVAHNQNIVPSFNLDERKISYRDGKWKLILSEREGRRELYKISEDPEETNNLVNEKKEKVKELKSEIKNHVHLEEKLTKKLGTRREIARIKKKAKTADKI